MPRAFRVDARNFAITYPNQANSDALSIRVLIDRFTALGSSYGIVCQELHEDGTPHYHALVQFPKKKDVCNQAFFDIAGCHPNVQGCRSVSDWSDYIMKTPNYEHYGQPTINNKQGYTIPDWENDSWAQWVCKCASARLPFQYAKAVYDNYTSTNSMLTIGEDYEQPPEAVIVNTTLQEFNIDTSEKTLIIVGPSGCGKTTWALKKAPKPALWVTHIDDLKHLTAKHKCIIFDDITFNHFPVQSQIHLVDSQQPRTIHIRYRTITIPRGIKRIFTCNEDPVNMGHAAVERRVDYLDLRSRRSL